MERTLRRTAAYFGISRPELIFRMRDKGLLTERNLPAFPTRDGEYLRAKASQWWHPQLGLQYSQSTRVKQAGIRWLAEQLGIELAQPPEERDSA